MLAIRSGHADTVTYFCESSTASLDEYNHRGRTALHVAVETGNQSLLKTVLHLLETDDQLTFINAQDREG
jgi:ankyrin repeat protein